MKFHLKEFSFLLLAFVILSNIARASSPDQICINKMPKDTVVIKFVDCQITTTYDVLCPRNIKCYFTPYKEKRLNSSYKEKIFGEEYPVIFLANITWKMFEKIFYFLTFECNLDLSDKYLKGLVRYLGYQDLTDFIYFDFKSSDFLEGAKAASFDIKSVNFNFVSVFDYLDQQENDSEKFLWIQNNPITFSQWSAIMGSAYPSVYKNLPYVEASLSKKEEFVSSLNEVVKKNDSLLRFGFLSKDKGSYLDDLVKKNKLPSSFSSSKGFYLVIFDKTFKESLPDEVQYEEVQNYDNSISLNTFLTNFHFSPQFFGLCPSQIL